MDADGDFVVVWHSSGSSGTDTDSSSIQAQRYNSSGIPQGSQFQVNTYTTSSQITPAVAMDVDGDFVVTWRSSGSSGTDTEYSSIQAQRYNSSGTAQAGEFQVNSCTTNDQQYPTVALNADGDFVVVWDSSGSSGTDTDSASIQGQRYNSSGTAQGGQFQVNSYTTSGQYSPAVALNADGDFMVAWWSSGSGGTDSDSTSIQAQRYNINGTTLGAEFQVNSYTTSGQFSPAVGLDTGGDFVVVWDSVGSGGTDSDDGSIQAQQFNLKGEQQVNTYTTNNQRFSAVATDADGDFVVTWHSAGSSGTDTDGNSIQAQRCDSAGTPQGNQFQINSYTTNNQRNPSVAMDADGDFVVTWLSDGSSGTDTSNFSVQAQRFNASGVPQGNEFQVNTYTSSNQQYPTVALDADGDFVITWGSIGSSGTDSDNFSIQAQRYNSGGTAQGGEFQVNTYTTSIQYRSAVAMDADGDFAVSWISVGSSGSDTDSTSVQVQRYNSSGTAQGGQFQVNSYTTSGQYAAGLAMDTDGNFVVSWASIGSSGTAQGSQFQVNTYATSSQYVPAVAMNGKGDFVVTWSSDGSSGTDSDGRSIQVQRFLSSGAAQGGEFQVNTYTTNNQRYPAVAIDSDGDFVVTWHSDGSNGTDSSSYSIQVHRFKHEGGPIPPPPPPTDAKIYLPIIRRDAAAASAGE